MSAQSDRELTEISLVPVNQDGIRPSAEIFKECKVLDAVRGVSGEDEAMAVLLSDAPAEVDPAQSEPDPGKRPQNAKLAVPPGGPRQAIGPACGC